MTEVTDLGNWIFYSSTKVFDKGHYYGEWLMFFGKQHYDYISDVCHKAVDNNIVKWCKHSSLSSVQQKQSGVVAFKMEGSDIVVRNGKIIAPKHINVLKFLRDNDLLSKTKSGRYVNIRYKLAVEGKGVHTGDWQGFSLSDFMDLETGCFKEDIAS